MKDEIFRKWEGTWKVLECKWSFHILRLIALKKSRFNDIRDSIGISPTTLSRRLRSMEKEGLILREVRPPLEVSYSLTKKGEKLVRLICQIENLDCKR